MKAKFKVNDDVKHIETSEVYKVIEVREGGFQFFYKLQTNQEIKIETLYPESALEILDKTTN